jgi:dTDP-4-amino-4,6-dideoxygalactose transaminase
MIGNDRVVEARKFRKSGGIVLGDSNFLYPFLRQGLNVLLKKSNYKTVLLPHFIPEGLYHPFLINNFDITFYDIDKDGNLDENIFERKFDIFVYVHYFGLYNQRNIQIIKDNACNYNLFLEDFAHSIYCKHLLSGDICTLSFTKMIGVTEGSCILLNDKVNCDSVYTKRNLKSFIIRYDLCTKMIINTLLIRRYFKLSKYIYYLFSFCKRIDYYKILMSSYEDCYPKMNKASLNLISTINFNLISKVRVEYAHLYLENITPNLLFDIPREYYLLQPLFAFPISVNNRDVFLDRLIKSGVKAFKLYSSWCFGNIKNRDFVDKHILLPINQNLSKEDLLFVVSVVNETYKLYDE